MTDFSKTLFRCSSLGYIMTEPRGKTPVQLYNEAVDEYKSETAKYEVMPNKELKSAKSKLEKINLIQERISELDSKKNDIVLSETCKTYLIQSYVLSKYQREKEVSTKQMEKGTVVEEDSIDLLSRVEKTMYRKNESKLTNEFISGTPDLFDTDSENIIGCNEIIDIKSSWDLFSFLSNVNEPMNSNYYWQLQGYMALTGAKIGTIAYCLVSTPQNLIESEKYKLLRSMDVVSEENPNYKIAAAKLEHNMIFDDISINERLLTISVKRSQEDIDKMYNKILKCREFLSEFEQNHLSFSNKNRLIVNN